MFRCKVEADSRNVIGTGRELRRSKTASRILPAEFTVEEPRTFTSEEDESKTSEKFKASETMMCKLLNVPPLVVPGLEGKRITTDMHLKYFS